MLPVALALILTTFLSAPVAWLERHNWRNGIAAFAVLVTGLLCLGGVIALVVPPTIDDISALDVSLSGGLEEVEEWLADGPLPLTDQQAATLVGRVQEAVNSNLDQLASRAVTGAAVTLEVLAGLALAVVLLFFFLKDGERIWAWVSALAPPQRRADVDEMGRRSWQALGGFLRGQTLVALFDAVFIAAALVILGVPLVLPLAVLTFFGAYVPIVGAVVAGAAAALVALVTDGATTALGVVAATIIVQQVEGNVFQPVVVGRAIEVHPVAVLLGVTAGAVLAGIIGAMVAAPIVAVSAAILSYLRERSDGERGAGAPPADLATRRAAPPAAS